MVLEEEVHSFLGVTTGVTTGVAVIVVIVVRVWGSVRIFILVVGTGVAPRCGCLFGWGDIRLGSG